MGTEVLRICGYDRNEEAADRPLPESCPNPVPVLVVDDFCVRVLIVLHHVLLPNPKCGYRRGIYSSSEKACGVASSLP